MEFAKKGFFFSMKRSTIVSASGIKVIERTVSTKGNIIMIGIILSIALTVMLLAHITKSGRINWGLISFITLIIELYNYLFGLPFTISPIVLHIATIFSIIMFLKNGLNGSRKNKKYTNTEYINSNTSFYSAPGRYSQSKKTKRKSASNRFYGMNIYDAKDEYNRLKNIYESENEKAFQQIHAEYKTYIENL